MAAFDLSGPPTGGKARCQSAGHRQPAGVGVNGSTQCRRAKTTQLTPNGSAGDGKSVSKRFPITVHGSRSGNSPARQIRSGSVANPADHRRAKRPEHQALLAGERGATSPQDRSWASAAIWKRGKIDCADVSRPPPHLPHDRDQTNATGARSKGKRTVNVGRL